VIFLSKYAAIIVCALIGWYTVNIARVAWAGGNRLGAVAAGLLAAVAAGFPISVLLIGGS